MLLYVLIALTQTQNIQYTCKGSLRGKNDKTLWDNEPSEKMLLNLFCVGHLLLKMRHALECGLYLQWDSLG